MAQWQTHTVASDSTLAEDVIDQIYNIDPTETPFTAMVKTGKANQPNHEWITDNLEAVGANAQIEGSDATYGDTNPAGRLDNRTQIFRKTFNVSETLQASRNYGLRNYVSYEAAKKAKELKRDIEYAFVGAGRQAKVVGDGSSTASKLQCAQAFIAAANTDANGGVDRDLNEAQIMGIMERVYTAGGNPDCIMIHPSHALSIAAFATSGTGTSRDFAASKTYVNAVDVIRTPYGDVDVVLNRFMDSGSAMILDKAYWSKDLLRPTKTEKLAKTGSSIKYMMETELTLAALNPDASGLIDDLTPVV